MDLISSLDSKSNKMSIRDHPRKNSLKYKDKNDEPEVKKLQYQAVKRKLGWTDKSMLYQILVKTLMIFSLNVTLLITLLHKGSN